MYERAEGDTPVQKIRVLQRILYKDVAKYRNARRRELYASNKQTLNQLTDAEYIKHKIKTGEWRTTINREKQLPHMESSRIEGKSYLYDTEDPQKLFDEYSGKGELNRLFNDKGHKERVEIDHVVGVDYNSGEETKWIIIHHSKGRTHIVPFKKIKKGEDK